MTNEEEAIEIIRDTMSTLKTTYNEELYVSIAKRLIERLKKEAGMVFLDEDQTPPRWLALTHQLDLIKVGWRKVRI